MLNRFELKKLVLFKFSKILCLWVCAHAHNCSMQSGEGVRFPGVAILGSCDTTYMDEGTLIQALCKNSEDF